MTSDGHPHAAEPELNLERSPEMRLAETAQWIQKWQQERRFSTSRMIRDYPALGSDKTYANMARGRTAEYDVERQLANYESVRALLEALDDSARQEPMYDDLSTVLHVRRAVLGVMNSTGLNRVVIVEGESGVGKSKAIEIVAGRYGRRIRTVEASDLWDDNPNPFLGEILRAFGVSTLPASRLTRMDEVLACLRASRTMLVVDEAHHLGKHSLNVLKTLVNQTPGEFVLLAIPTLWTRLETAAYMEARQLTTNRLAERLKLRLTQADAARYLERRGLPEEACAEAARVVVSMARHAGNMAFVRDVASELCRTQEELTPTRASAAALLVARRKGAKP